MTQAALARIRYGCDPELFLSSRTPVEEYMDAKGKKRKKYDYRPIPICGLVGGTKQSPLELTNKLPGWEAIINIPNGAKIQEDGTALEFNTYPADSSRRMVRDVSYITHAIEQYAGRKDLAIWKKPTAEFKEEDRKTNPQAFIIGCDPDLNAYTNTQRTPPDNVKDSLLRHAGGHFHIGYDKELVPPSIVVQFLDLFLGLPSVFADKQGVRRQFYGQAGSFRIKEYGVEYRTLSNFWLPQMHIGGAELSEMFFSSADSFMTHLMTKMEQLEHLHRVIDWGQVQTAINTENETLAEQVLGFGSKINKELFYRPLQYIAYCKAHIKKKAFKKAEEPGF